MKKFFLLVAIVALTMSASAQLLLNENFKYNSSILCNVEGDPNANADPYNVVGTWYETGKSGDSNSASLKLEPEPLFYSGYINSGDGKSVKIDWGTAGTENRVDICRFIEHAKKIKTGKLYYAFMMQVNDAHSFSTTTNEDAGDWRDIFCIAEGGSDVAGNAFRGRFFIQVNPDDPTKVNYSISKNTAFASATPPDNIGTINAGQTYLVVIRQTFTGAGATDAVEVTVDPAIVATEPATGWINGKPSDSNAFGGTYAVALRRRNLGSTSDIRVAGLRVGYTFADAVGVPTALNNTIENNKNIKAISKAIITNEIGNVKVFNLTGNEMLSAKTNGSLETNLNKGFYLVRFVSENGHVSSAKVEIK